MNALRLTTKYDRVELALVTAIALLMIVGSSVMIWAAHTHQAERLERITTMKCHNMYRTEVPCP